jgi:preprotein translocase subunit SecA
MTAFFLSLEDDLVRRLDHNGRVAAMLEKLGHVEGEPLGHPVLTRSLSSAQTRGEKADYDRRQQTEMGTTDISH